MEQKAIENFKGKQVKLKYHNGFNLIGTILEVYKDSILFKTKTASSLISLDEIGSLVEYKGGY